MSLRSLLKKFPKYGDFIAFFCFLIIIFVLSFRPNKTLFDYFLIIFSIGGLTVDGLSMFLTLTSAK
jgi:hypothetical protein